MVYRFHKSKGYKQKTTPFLDKCERGILSCRYPRRLNQIEISVVKLLSRDKNILTVKHVDMLDGTPLLDSKSHNPHFEPKKVIRVGWDKKVMNAVPHQEI